MRIALTKIGNKAWTGGSTYLRNFSGTINSKLKNKILLYLISDPGQISPEIKSNFSQIINHKRSILFTLSQIFSTEINKISKKFKIDVLFETTEFLGFFCNTKVVSWIPDFQHKYYPEYFNLFTYLKREISFRIKFLIRDRILLSSENAKNDCIKFYKVNPKKLFVAPFSIDLDPAKYLNNQKYLKEKYKINENFFYIPNQFWRHKNHKLIFDFLNEVINNAEEYKQLPEFIFTGLSLDNRNKNFSDQLLKTISSNKFRNKVKYLGLVPLEDVYFLNANCTALINPSFFEGWSTTVEEAKSLGTKMLLSNIEIHKEQAPTAYFFEPQNIEDFKKTIFNFIANKKNMNNQRDIKEINEYAEKRKIEYSIALQKAFNFEKL